jgi:hypothetical protein
MVTLFASMVDIEKGIKEKKKKRCTKNQIP